MTPCVRQPSSDDTHWLPLVKAKNISRQHHRVGLDFTIVLRMQASVKWCVKLIKKSVIAVH